MVTTTRSRSGVYASQKQAEPDMQLQDRLSLLSWTNASRRKSKSATVREAQTASLLSKLPLDVLAIIFSFCPPLDLLQVGRTCIDLKIFFHSKASQAIWVASRQTVSITLTEEDVYKLPAAQRIDAGFYAMPDCPVWLSEAQYAAYAVESACTYCATKKGDRQTGTLISRACNTCRRAFVSLKHLQTQYGDDADARLYLILPKIDDAKGTKQRVNERVYHKPTCQAIFDKAIQSEIAVNFDARAMDVFYQKGEEEMAERFAFKQAYSKFEGAYDLLPIFDAIEAFRKAAALIERNRTIVATRLGEEGIQTFDTDISDCPEANAMILAQTQEVDDAAFDNIKQDMIRLLKPVQEERRYLTSYFSPEHAMLRPILNGFRVALPNNDRFPSTLRMADFFELPTCKALAYNADFLEGDAAARRAIWDTKLCDVRADIAAWASKQEASLLEMLEEKKRVKVKALKRSARLQVYDVDLSKEYLRMPYIRLTCSHCRSAGMVTAQLLTHDCYETFHRHNLYYTCQRLLDNGINLTGLFESPLLVRSEGFDLDWETTFFGKQIYDAIAESGEEVPGTMEGFYHKTGLLTCDDCPKSSIMRMGVSVAESFNGHIRAAPSARMMNHCNFNYLPTYGNVEQAADMAIPAS